MSVENGQNTANLAGTLLDLLPDLTYIKDLDGRFLFNNRAHALALGAKTVEETIGKTDFDYYPAELAQLYRQRDLHVLQTGETLENKASKVETPFGPARYFHSTKVPLRDRDGKIVGLIGILRDITSMKEVEEQLRRAYEQQEQLVAERTQDLAKTNLLLREQIEERDKIQAELNQHHQMLRGLVDNIPDLIFIKDTESRFVLLNQACATQLGVSRQEEVLGKSDADFLPPDLAQRYRTDEVAVMESGETLHHEEPVLHKDSGKMGWSLTTKLPLKGVDGKMIGLMGIARDITPLKEAEQKVDQIHKELVSASRLAGMAEIAVGVLHNVGNVLNSVNISCSIIQERMRKSRADRLGRLLQLFEEHKNDLADFLANDERGRKVPAYLKAFSDDLEREREAIIQEADCLATKVAHIKEIVAAQQECAKMCGVVEKVDLAHLVEDALKFNGAAFERHKVAVIRDFDPVPSIMVDKHKVLQILVNLLQNAKQACSAGSAAEKQVTVRIKARDERVIIAVTDNGVGIPPENLGKIFSQGFTTRKGGHGFGLHSGALAARELKGSLAVASDGRGRGATFTLDLPLKRAEANN
jgi:PAS domain S-box-containing protein